MLTTTVMTILGVSVCVTLLATLLYLLVALIVEVACWINQRRTGQQCAYTLTRIDLDDLRRRAEWNAMSD